MAKTKSKIAVSKASEPEREGNRYTRAARVLANDDSIDVKTLGDKAFMSETTATRCLEAWNACVAALIEVGRLPDPAKKKAAPKPKPVPVAKPASTETTGETSVAGRDDRDGGDLEQSSSRRDAREPAFGPAFFVRTENLNSDLP